MFEEEEGDDGAPVPAPSRAPSPPNRTTRAVESATSRPSARRCACKARTKNAMHVLTVWNVVFDM